MISKVSQYVSRQVSRIITQLRGFEETGLIGIDCVSLSTRDALREFGVL